MHSLELSFSEGVDNALCSIYGLTALLSKADPYVTALYFSVLCDHQDSAESLTTNAAYLAT